MSSGQGDVPSEISFILLMRSKVISSVTTESCWYAGWEVRNCLIQLAVVISSPGGGGEEGREGGRGGGREGGREEGRGGGRENEKGDKHLLPSLLSLTRGSLGDEPEVLHDGAASVHVNINTVDIHPHQWNEPRELVLRP